jgi:hypothetical protein
MFTTAGSDEEIYTDLELSYTYNVSPMFNEALSGFTDGIRTIDGMRGRDAENGLLIGVIGMQSEPKKYIAMNPDNGWGNYEGALEVLQTLLKYARKYPDAVFRVD